MSRQTIKFWAFSMVLVTLATGCQPMQPFFLQEDGDLSHYLDRATEIDYPDVYDPQLVEAAESYQPRTIVNTDFDEIWDLSLQEAVHIALHNSKVIRALPGGTNLVQTFQGSLNGSVSLPRLQDTTVQGADAISTIYDPALIESNPNTGVEHALAAFDAQLAISSTWERQDQPQNVDLAGAAIFPPVSEANTGTTTIELSKRTAAGTTFFARNNTIYNRNNSPLNAIPSSWTANLEIEARHPFLRGNGTQINRIPVILARINTDISLVEFEGNVRDLVRDVEDAYWELSMAYRKLKSDKTGRDSALVLWRQVQIQVPKTKTVQEEAQARQQYFEFRARVEAALADLYKAENRLRYLLGLAATDHRLIRPVDDPTLARAVYDWNDVRAEALIRSPNLRRQKWRIQQRNLELIAARNNLLPQLDAVALYRWLGVGDDLIEAPRKGLNFPAVGSLAWDELTEGRYEEWRLGFEFTLPVGFRSELASVRNAQLQLARDRAVLESLELELVHQLTDAIQNVETFLVLAQTNFNRWAASDKEVKALEQPYRVGQANIDALLDAQRRRANAEIAYDRALINYNRALTNLHYRKGSLLEHNDIFLAEGPWPAKAYYDAHQRARRRDASYYFDYGYTRPGVVSRGPYMQHGSGMPMEVIGEPMPTPAGEVILPGQPAEDVEVIPTPDPIPGDNGSRYDSPKNAPGPVASAITRPPVVKQGEPSSVLTK